MKRCLLFLMFVTPLLCGDVNLTIEDRRTVIDAGGDPDRCEKYVFTDTSTGVEQEAIICKPYERR